PCSRARPEPDDEPRGAGRGGLCAGRARLGPRDVRRARTVAGLARHGDLGPLRRVAVLRRLVALPEIRRVALRALVVPGLVASGPVEWVPGREPLRVEREPALAARVPGASVPGQAQRLEPALGKGDEVLLKRPHPERV